jgi:hypothetical protein
MNDSGGSEVLSWVIELDQSERADGSNGTPYRRYFFGALDTTDSNSTKLMGDFDSRNATVDEESLALLECDP